MKNLLTGIAISLLSTCASAAELAIIPQPNHVQVGEGAFSITPRTTVRASEEARATGEYLRDLLRPAMGFALSLEEATGNAAVADAILLTLKNADKALGSEGYELAVSRESVVVRANTSTGLFYGIQTLRQLLPVEIESPDVVKGESWILPAVTISDAPRFEWRGMLLDVCRHFFGVDAVKRFIDRIAMHKFNRLHLHLTDDQGWRIEIDAYPRLAEIASTRSETRIGKSDKYDATPHGGIFTKAEIREIIAYAAARHIIVIPEIEMPGHSQAALAAYPKLGCRGSSYAVRTRWGISADVYCVGKDETVEFLKNVLDEVCELFPGPYVHIGGDECKKNAWKRCAHCQKRIKDMALKDEHELQSWFVSEINKHLSKNGKQMVGWEEILEGDLQAKATIMAWRGAGAGAVEAIHGGHSVVMAPGNYTYLDKYQGPKESEPLAIGGKVYLDVVYGFEPVPEALRGTPGASHIIGAQGQLWSEYIPNEEHLEYMAFPRACALSEVLWQPAATPRNCDEFRERLSVHMQRLTLQGINARPLDKN